MLALGSMGVLPRLEKLEDDGGGRDEIHDLILEFVGEGLSLDGPTEPLCTRN